MEDCTRESNSRKRVRVTFESDSHSTDSKRVRAKPNSPGYDRLASVDLEPVSLEVTKVSDVSKLVRTDSEINSSECKRVHSEESGLDSPEVKKIRDDILDILDDLETVTDREPEIQDLDSFIKSFEEEILHPPPVSDSGELGYLLEASDDELGLPPAVSPSGEPPKNQSSDVSNLPSEPFGFGDSVVFENELPSYDPFEFAFGEETGSNNDDGNGDFVTVGGLFDYSEFSWRPESLPAL